MSDVSDAWVVGDMVDGLGCDIHCEEFSVWSERFEDGACVSGGAHRCIHVDTVRLLD